MKSITEQVMRFIREHTRGNSRPKSISIPPNIYGELRQYIKGVVEDNSHGWPVDGENSDFQFMCVNVRQSIDNLWCVDEMNE